MKRYLTMNAALAGTVCMLLAVASTHAEDQLRDGKRDQSQRATTNRDRAQAGNLDDKTTGANVRVSELIGMNIQNAKGEDVGEINDLVLDANTGRIRYAAVTYGGFLGLGNKMFAVPFQAFKVQTEANDSDDYVLVLNVTQQQMEGAQGFDEDNWPNFADRTFTDSLDQRYGVKTRQNRVGVRVDRERKDVDIDVNKKPLDNR